MNNEPRISQAGKTLTFDELFNAHQEKVLRAAYRVTGNLHDSEDILQSVFLRQLDRGDQALSAERTGAYLCKSAINASLDLLRSRRRAPSELLNEELLPSTHGAADGDVRQAEQRLLLRTALLDLDQRAAEVFALRMFENFSNSQIAVVLGISANGVAVAFHKARAQLQHTLGELEGDNR